MPTCCSLIVTWVGCVSVVRAAVDAILDFVDDAAVVACSQSSVVSRDKSTVVLNVGFNVIGAIIIS